jgi:hypothetical protein
MHERITHDAAWATATSILECLGNCLREEERGDAFAEIYSRVKAGIEAAFLYANRQQDRLKPGRN